MKALILSADHFEDTELLFPYYRLLEEGFDVDVASMSGGQIHGKHGYDVTVGQTLQQINPAAYDLLVLPGGKAPQAVRKEPAALAIAQHFMQAGKVVAAICHGPQILVSAGVLTGRRATCAPSVAEELKHAGALYEDQEVVVDGKLVTSRRPADLPAFMRETLKLLPRRTT